MKKQLQSLLDAVCSMIGISAEVPKSVLAKRLSVFAIFGFFTILIQLLFYYLNYGTFHEWVGRCCQFVSFYPKIENESIVISDLLIVFIDSREHLLNNRSVQLVKRTFRFALKWNLPVFCMVAIITLLFWGGEHLVSDFVHFGLEFGCHKILHKLKGDKQIRFFAVRRWLVKFRIIINKVTKR